MRIYFLGREIIYQIRTSEINIGWGFILMKGAGEELNFRIAISLTFTFTFSYIYAKSKSYMQALGKLLEKKQPHFTFTFTT